MSSTRSFSLVIAVAASLFVACSATNEGSPALESFGLEEALMYCAPTFDAQVAVGPSTCVCADSPTFCHASSQRCGDFQFWVSSPDTMIDACAYGSDGALIAASICPDAGPCRQFGPAISRPAKCEAVREMCPN
jgi:hypothetical protein